MTTIRVVVADDHALVREGIAGLIDAEGDLEVVGTAADHDGLLDAVDRLVPDVVVTDIRMPPTGTDEGIRVAAELRDRHPEVGVVVLSMFADARYARALLGDGTDGRAYLLKPRVQATDELLAAIRTVAGGGSVVDPAVVETLLAADRPTRARELDRLTARERDVLAAMARGESNATIAERLHVSLKTVESHVGSIFMKLDLADEHRVSRRVAAVLAWLDEVALGPT
ncbi:MAG TPA: response regulator transcription factor [Acidimicrobiales bacterium]